jgi:serine/threonine protein phosphatase PrpC
LKAGGFVNFVAGKWRVGGRLAVSRSFGDESMKPMVTADPELAQVTITEQDELVLLSCDGIYEAMTEQEVADFLDESLKNGIRPGQLAHALVAEAVSRNSADDITGTFCSSMLMCSSYR